MLDVIFREYDIRGKVGTELKLDEVYDLTLAIVYYFKQQNPDIQTIAVGMDGRLHSPAIKEEMCRAIQDSGLDVLFIGMCPSPVLYFALYTEPVQAGLMITASHNTKEYNGIKINLGKGSVWGSQIQEIKNLYKEKKHIVTPSKGTFTQKVLIPSYIDWLANHFAHLIGMQLPTVIDCANAVGGMVIPQLVERMQWSHATILYPEIDGNYPNHEADPTVEENMQDVKACLARDKAALGIGLDGDCDRMAAMTQAGYLVPGDQLLALFAYDMLKNNPGSAVVFDIKSSSGLIEVLEKFGARPVVAATGHSHIKEAMHTSHAVLGGELSCHFFFNDRYFGYDDGIYAMMRLLEIIEESGKTLEQLLTIFPKKYSSREFRIPCREEDKKNIIGAVRDFFSKQEDAQLITIDGVRANFSKGWGIVRPSNTQPVLSLRFESDSPHGLQDMKQLFIEALLPYYTNTQLQDFFKL